MIQQGCKYKLLAKRVVNMTGYWPCSFLLFTDRDGVEVHKHAIKEQGQHPAILTEQAWSIEDLIYGIHVQFGFGNFFLQDIEHNPEQARKHHLAHSGNQPQYQDLVYLAGLHTELAIYM